MVLLEGYYRQPEKEVFKQFKDYIKDTVIMRLYGPDRSGIEKKTKEKLDKMVSRKDEQPDDTAEIVHYFTRKKTDVYLNINNHYLGSAPLTIREVKKLISNF